MAKSRFEGSEFSKLIAANGEIDRLRRQLARANRIIGWMMPHIARMAPPDGGLADLNEHCCDNKVPDPSRKGDDRPIDQRPAR